MCSARAIDRGRSPLAGYPPKNSRQCGRASSMSRCAPSVIRAVGVAPRLRQVVQNVSGITTRQGELFPSAEPGPQFYPVSAIDYLTGYLMAAGAMVALARRAKEGGSWLVRISLAQTGRWLVDRGEVPETALKDVPKEFPQAEIDRWSIDSDTPAGKLRHLGPTVHLSETRPYWARPSVPLGYNQPIWPARAA